MSNFRWVRLLRYRPSSRYTVVTDTPQLVLSQFKAFQRSQLRTE